MDKLEQVPPIDEKQIKAYRLFQQMMRYPNLTKEMREIFLEALKKTGLVSSREEISSIAAEWLQGENPDAELLREYENILIDYFFANAFDRIRLLVI